LIFILVTLVLRFILFFRFRDCELFYDWEKRRCLYAIRKRKGGCKESTKCMIILLLPEAVLCFEYFAEIDFAYRS
jgi:hypothetical protein